MITFICVLAIVGLGQCLENPVPARAEIEVSINRTIDEVEWMIREDPSLPRLSRQQIVDILFNITSMDAAEAKERENVDQARSMYQKALMVVLPYNAKESAETLKDLYTKPPMVQIIPDTGVSGPIHAESIEVTSENTRDIDYDNTVATYTTSEFTTKSKDSYKQRYKNHRETYSDIQASIPEILKTDTAPMRFSFNLENLQKKSYDTHRSGTVTRRPVYRRITTKKNENTTPARESEKKVNGEIAIDLRTTEYTTPGSRTSENVLSSDQWQYFAPPSTTVTSLMKSSTEKTVQEVTEEPEIVTTIRVVMGDVVTKKGSAKTSNEDEKMVSTSPATVKILPEDAVEVSDMKETMMMDAAVEEMAKETNRPLFMTPMSSTTSQRPKYSSTYSLNAGGFRASTTSTPAPMKKEVEELLASIGLRPDNDDNIEDIYKKNNEIFESKFRIPDTKNLAFVPTSGLTSVNSESASITTQNTFENVGSDFRKGVDNLTPDVQLLFQRFGLQNSQQHQIAESLTTTTTKAPMIFNSYTNFKPLPTSGVKDREMKDFLARFGLGISENRGQKAMKVSTELPSLIEAVPQDMKKILRNIGLISRAPLVSSPPAMKSTTPTPAVHVFKPHETILKDETKRMKINELLDTVKMVQQGTASVGDVQKIADNLLKDAKTLKPGPDPLSLEEILKLYNDDLKNEVKRQQNETELTQQDQQAETTRDAESGTTLMAVATTESTSLSLDSAKAASEQTDSSASSSDLLDSLTSSTTAASVDLDALAESFGGSTAAPDPVLPTRRRSGFYFLVDWNTFLEVGEDGKDKVNLRFQPKAGDRTRFLPVNVP